MRQLAFDLPRAEAWGEDSFFVSPANAAAHALIQDDARWPQGKLALVGPAGAGKTHLARIWAVRRGAALVGAAGIAGLPRPAAGAAVVVEGMDTLPPEMAEPLFHLHNLILAGGGRLLLTARTPPARWPIALPDLASRMQATSAIRIEEPDDALLFAVLAKGFADRQLAPEPGLIPWLLPRIERSFAAAAAVVARLDSAALREGRDITRAFARAVMDKDAAAGDSG